MIFILHFSTASSRALCSCQYMHVKGSVTVYYYGKYFTVSSHDPDGPVTSSHTELERKLTSSSISSQDSALGKCVILCMDTNCLQNLTHSGHC